MAEIKFPCPGCKITLKVSDALAGKKIKCPKCAAIAPVPAAGAAPPPAPAPAAKPAAPPAAAAPVAAKPPAPAKAAAPGKPAVPLAKPIAPQIKKPAAPVEEPTPAAPPLEFSGFDNEQADNETPASTPPSRKKTPSPPKKRGSFVPVLVLLLVCAYIAGLALVYFDVLLPMPEALKGARAKTDPSRRPTPPVMVNQPPRIEEAQARRLHEDENRRQEAAQAEQKSIDEIGKTAAGRNNSAGALARFAEGDEAIIQIAFSPDGQALAAASEGDEGYGRGGSRC